MQDSPPGRAPVLTCGLYLPYHGFQEKLSEELLQRYEAALSNPHMQTLHTGLPGQDALSFYLAMVDGSDGLVCITGQQKHRAVTAALQYAKKQGRVTCQLSPLGGRIISIDNTQ